MDDHDDAPFALVVDDEPFIRMGACDMLADAGFRCLDAADAMEAEGLLREHGDYITVLFTDVDLGPGPSGFEVARTAVKLVPMINILVASGAARPLPGDLPEGAVFISKPFSADVVHARLQELLPDGQKPGPLRRGVVG